MKKFYAKVSRPQWRITLPNINEKLFKKSSNNDNNLDKSFEDLADNCKNSGSYDVKMNQDKMENSTDAPESIKIIVDCNKNDETTDDSDQESKYEDASPMYEKKITCLNNTRSAEDINIYADVENIKPSSKTETNATYEYDIPKISFSFFEDLLQNQNKEEQTVEEVQHKEEEDPTPASLKRRSEIRIVLASPPTIEEEEEEEISTFKNQKSSSLDNISILASRCEIDLEGKIVEMKLSSNTSSLGKLSKCDSEPKIDMRLKEEEENFYNVPRAHKRLSQSLNNFNIITSDEENCLTYSMSEATINSTAEDHMTNSVEPGSIPGPTETSEETHRRLEYCEVRSNLPKLRRASLLRRPRDGYKAQDTWTTLRSKVSNMISTHSAAQRVGANPSGDKLLNLDDFYKHSRTKYRKFVHSTSKIFNKKRSHENIKQSSDTSSQIVKNDAFFAKINLHENNSEMCGSVADCSEISDKFGSKILGGDKVINDFDIGSIKSAFRRSKYIQEVLEGQNGFDDLRRFVKQGGDFCKELSVILYERCEAEQQYAKSLNKLSAKLLRACREGVGGLNEACKSVAVDMEQRGDVHRQVAAQLGDDIVKPLKQLCEQQHKQRKQVETLVDKTARCLADWRAAEAKSKKHSHACARDNEKLQDQLLDVRLSKSISLAQLAHLQNHKTLSDKESAKLEGKKRKAEDAVKKSDIEYYTLCVRAERARLEWESAVLRGTNTFQTLEEERLKNLKMVLTSYLQYSTDIYPKLMESTTKMQAPVTNADATKDLSAFINLRNTSQQVSEQLLPDFYCEHITLAMNRERRKQALIKLLHLIKQDLERERKSKNGLENLSRAIKQTPNFGSEDSQQNVGEKLYHMRSMLTYLEGARYKVASALCEMESRPRASHPLAQHITVMRDKSGLQQSVLKVPQWLKEEFIGQDDEIPVQAQETLEETAPCKTEVDDNEVVDWTDDRGCADGNSNQHDSDFDEFSSEEENSGEAGGGEADTTTDICSEWTGTVQGQCRALYVYTANLPDELSLRPGDTLQVYRKQEDGWWLGECNGTVGIFPATYVENI